MGWDKHVHVNTIQHRYSLEDTQGPKILKKRDWNTTEEGRQLLIREVDIIFWGLNIK
ncbi:hypothetical protein HanXRQr2_Chr14g0628541 [Helianthus annuus]|uniref:Uncharacterized protein n=1 Tax=Helianthus annuus TaxID=4232 RepID=A0A251SIG7_HELAN|nr:hypothetical protein HanXRQr2_Chr14g0628541 [Helianthus annuus]